MVPKGSRPRDFVERTEALRVGRTRHASLAEYAWFEEGVVRAESEVHRWFSEAASAVNDVWWSALELTGRAAQGLEEVRVTTHPWTGGSIFCPRVPREHQLIRSAEAALAWDHALVEALLGQWRLQARMADPLLFPCFDPVGYARHAVWKNLRRCEGVVVAGSGERSRLEAEELRTRWQMPREEETVKIRALGRPVDGPPVEWTRDPPEPRPREVLAEVQRREALWRDVREPAPGGHAQQIRLPWRLGSGAPTPRCGPPDLERLRQMQADAERIRSERAVQEAETFQRATTEEITARRNWRHDLQRARKAWALERRSHDKERVAEMLRADTLPPDE